MSLVNPSEISFLTKLFHNGKRTWPDIQLKKRYTEIMTLKNINHEKDFSVVNISKFTIFPF